MVLGGGACVVLGGLVLLGASADAENAQPSAPVASTAPAETGTPNGVPSPTSTVTDDDEGSSPAPVASAKGGGSTAPQATTWTCNASGSVRVCGFANVCNYQTVFGTGVGSDRYQASTMAKNACQGMAIAKGGSTVCVVTCTPRSR